MSVCRFNRPTSCRPCLTSSIALLYRILSGSAVFSALVDLFTFFFLWKICASHVVALSRNSPPAATIASHFALTPKKVRRKLSPLSLVWDSFPQIAQAHVLSGSADWPASVYPERRTRLKHIFALPARSPELPLSLMLRRRPVGCFTLPTFDLSQTADSLF